MANQPGADQIKTAPAIALPDWAGRARPCLPATGGRFVSVVPFDAAAHGEGLFAAIGGPDNDDLWTYIPLSPPTDAQALCAVLSAMAADPCAPWVTHVFLEPETAAPLGMASFMRLREGAGSAEVGCVIFSKALQRRPAATEAMYVMARHLFDDLGYRRYEWKCDRRNAASMRAAERLGFQFEGVFRQDQVVKGNNRDTAWFSMIDADWPALKAGFEAWLAAENFDAAGAQRRSLAICREMAVNGG